MDGKRCKAVAGSGLFYAVAGGGWNYLQWAMSKGVRQGGCVEGVGMLLRLGGSPGWDVR
ncbi:MAG: hypothetical protein IT424_02890 [Pirellulales bacterium]|nr:hypothetical protein [Pirellulales bacterium]